MNMKNLIMNRKGAVSIEALIAFSVALLLMGFLIQLLLFLPDEEVKTQQLYDAIVDFEIFNYAYEKIGVKSIELPKFKWSNELNQLLDSLKEYGEAKAYKMVFQKLLEDYDLSLEEFLLEDGILRGRVAFEKSFLLAGKREFFIAFEKRIWLFGDQKELYPNVQLSSLIHEDSEADKKRYVYMTVSGEKYHMEGCFYLMRSTTLHEHIKHVTVYEAERTHYLKPCERCYGR